jgi:hypothetical protein
MNEEEIVKQLQKAEDECIKFDKEIFERAFDVNTTKIHFCDLEINKCQKLLHTYDSVEHYYWLKYWVTRKREDKEHLDDANKKRLAVYNNYIYALLNKDINVRRRYLDGDMSILCEKWGNITKKEHNKQYGIIQARRNSLLQDERDLMLFYIDGSNYELIEPLVAKNTEAMKVVKERAQIVSSLED